MTDIDKILEAIREVPLTTKDIAQRTGYSESAVSDALIFLSLRKGQIKSVAGPDAMRWVVR